MKFLRRNRSDKSDASEEPAAKRRRVEEEDEEEDTSFDDKTVELQEEMGKRSRDRNIAIIQQLTSETFDGRRDWLKKNQPLASDVLLKFPSLKLRKVVSDKIIAILSTLAEFINYSSGLNSRNLLDSWIRPQFILWWRIGIAGRNELFATPNWNHTTEKDSKIFLPRWIRQPMTRSKVRLSHINSVLSIII